MQNESIGAADYPRFGRVLDSVLATQPDIDMQGYLLTSRSIAKALGLDDAQPRVLFYPGSSIGNFTPEEALPFLSSLHRACGGATCRRRTAGL